MSYNGKRVVGTVLLQELKSALTSKFFDLEYEYQIVKRVCSLVPNIIKEASSDAENLMLPRLLELLNRFRLQLDDAGTPGSQLAILQDVEQRSRIHRSIDELKDFGVRGYYDKIMLSAKDALLQCEKHVPKR